MFFNQLVSWRENVVITSYNSATISIFMNFNMLWRIWIHKFRRRLTVMDTRTNKLTNVR